MSGFDLSNFIASFFDEARERLSSINQALVAFEAGTLDDEGLVALRRDAHTIKGSALMLGVNDVGGIAHIFEDLVELLIEAPEMRTDKATQFMYDLHDILDKRLEDPDGKELLDEKEIRAKYDALLPDLKAGASVNADGQTSEQPLAEDVKASDQPADDMYAMIGAEEVRDRKAQKELEAKVDESEQGTSEPDVFEVIEEDGAYETAFRPFIQNASKAGTGQRKSSGRFLRVDAERMETLSNQVIEISTEQSRNKRSEADLQAARVDLRTLRREWRKTRYLLDAEGEEQAASTIEYMIDIQMRHLRRMSEEARYQAERNELTLKELRDQVLGLMVRPLDTIFSTFPRAVRDVATKAGKKVQLVLMEALLKWIRMLLRRWLSHWCIY